MSYAIVLLGPKVPDECFMPPRQTVIFSTVCESKGRSAMSDFRTGLVKTFLTYVIIATQVIQLFLSHQVEPLFT